MSTAFFTCLDKSSYVRRERWPPYGSAGQASALGDALVTLVKVSQDFLLVSGRYVETLIIQKQAVVREAEMCAVLYKKLHDGRSIARSRPSVLQVLDDVSTAIVVALPC